MDQTMQRAQCGGGKGRAPGGGTDSGRPAQARVASTGSLNRAPGEWTVVTLQGCRDSSGEWEEIN